MSANDDVWRRPPDGPAQQTAGADPARRADPARPARPAGGPGTGPAPVARPAPRPEDAGWARPPGGRAVTEPPGARAPAAPQPPRRPEYTGPPPTNPPPANWRPPVVAELPAPGTLPTQDHDRLDVEEQAARTLTTGIGMVIGAILFVLLLVLCARVVF